MTRETAQKLLKNTDLIAVYASGGHIQERVFGGWEDVSEPYFDRPPEAYRVKPREPREVWVTIYKDLSLEHSAFVSAAGVYTADPGPVSPDRETIRFREILTDETP